MKKEFRKKVINLRKEKDKDFIKHNSDIITDKLLNLDCIKNAKNIMLYLDFNNEVSTDSLIKKLLKKPFKGKYDYVVIVSINKTAYKSNKTL